MRKKFTMLLASLFLVMGTAWAQVLADGVYTIQADENGKRGYLAASSVYERPVLTEISWDAYRGNSCTTNIVENSKMWYIKTINGVSYLYNIGNGEFIIDNNTDNIFFGENPYGLNITEHSGYTHIGSGTGVRFLSMGCGTTAPNQVKWEKGNGNDGGCLLTLTEVENGQTTYATQIATANAKIEAFENPSVLFNKNSTAALPGTLDDNEQYTWRSSVMTAPSNFTTLRLTFMKTTNNAKDLGGYPHVNIAEFYLYDETGAIVELTTDKFSSNATETKEGKSGLHRLCDGTYTKLDSDGNNDWYWHSLWSSNAGAYHYLEINVADIPNLSTFAVGYVTRQEDGTPTELLVTTGSSTEVVAAKCPNVTVTYNHLLGGVSKRTEEFKTVVGASYPAPSLPWGVKVVTDLSGVVTEGGTKDIEVAYNGELPFTPSESFETAHWYYLKFTKDARYIRYNEADTYIPTDLDKIYANVDPEAYAWAFVGDPYGEYKLMNRKAGSTKVLSSTRYIYDGNTGGNTCPLMKEESGINETTDNKTWIVDKSTSIAGVNGMFIGLKTSTNETKYMNSRGKLAFWTGGQGDGSTFQTEEFNYMPAFVVAKEEALKSLQALAAISDKTEAAKTAIEALDPTTSDEALAAFTTLNEKMNSVVSGEYFTLQNKSNTDIYLTTDGTNASATTTVDIKAYWTLKNKNGLFYLYNKYNNAYLQRVPTSNETKITITSQENLAAAYRAVLPTAENNVWALTSFESAGNGDTKFIHKAGDNRIVRWNATAEASQWTIAEVDYAAVFSALVESQLEGKEFNETPALGEYPTSVKNAFDALKEAYLTNPTDENEIALVDCIDELEKAKNLPVFTIDGVISYAAGKSVYDDQNGAPNFKATNVYDKTMWWVFDQTTVTVGETESVNVVNYATRNGFWGAEALKITETSEANTEDGIFLFYTVGNNTPLHYQNDNQVIVRWDSKASDSGSATKFTYIGNTYDLDKLTDEHIAALPALQAAYNAKAFYADAVLGEGLGQYKGTADDKAAIVATLAPAKAILNGTLAQQANTTVEDINAAAEAINNVAALEINLPEAGKFYRFQGACEASLPGYYITGHTNADGGRIALTAEADASTIYYFDGTNLTAYQSGLVVGLNESHWTFASIADNSKPASTITFAGSPRQAGKYTIKSANRYFHYTVYNGTVQVNRCQDDVCKEHDWNIAEITELPVTITAAGYATLYAPVALTIADGVTAYTATIAEDGKTLDLNKVEGTIPAETGVILEADPKTYNFAVAADVAEIEGNALVGSFAKSVKNADKKVYTLQKPADKEVGFYLFEGQNAQGATTYINGFRAWVELDADSQVPALALGRGEGTTAIDNAQLATDNVVIYDLTGRRVEKMEKGIYIVNGKKVVIK